MLFSLKVESTYRQLKVRGFDSGKMKIQNRNEKTSRGCSQFSFPTGRPPLQKPSLSYFNEQRTHVLLRLCGLKIQRAVLSPFIPSPLTFLASVASSATWECWTRQSLVVSSDDYALLAGLPCPTCHKAILFLFKIVLEDVLGYVIRFLLGGLRLCGNTSHLTYFLWGLTACSCVLAKTSCLRECSSLRLQRVRIGFGGPGRYKCSKTTSEWTLKYLWMK